MKNVKKEQLKKCIFLTLDEFNKAILNITDGLKCACAEYYGMYFEDTPKAEETNVYYDGDIYEALRDYYDINISSIHCDDYTPVGVWIVYK